MSKLLAILKKNFTILLRNPLSALIIILGPLLLVTLLGFTFNSSSDLNLKISAYSDSYSPLSESIITLLETQKMTITKATSQEDCIRGVQDSTSQLCMVFAPNFAADATSELTFHVDYSQTNLVWYVLDQLSKVVQDKSSELSQSFSSDVLQRLSSISSDLEGANSQAGSLEQTRTEIAQKVDSSLSNVQSINVDFGVNSSQVSHAVTTIETGSTSLDTYHNSLTSDLSSLKTLATSIQSSISTLISGTNDTTQRNRLVEANTSVTSLLNNISSIQNSSNTNVSAISLSLIEAQSSLSGVSLAIQQIEAKSATANSAKSTSEDALTESKEQLNSLQTSITAVQTGINTAKERATSVSLTSNQISSPIKTSIQPVNKQGSHFNNMYPTLIVLIAMITSILLAAIMTNADKTSKAHLRNVLTPTSTVLFNIATFLTAIILISIQMILFITVSTIFFSTSFSSGILVLLLSVLLVSSVFIMCGMIIGHVFRSQETVVLGSITLASLFLFLSNTILPLVSMPQGLQKILMYSPFVLAESIIRKVLILDMNFLDNGISLLIILGYVIGLYVIFNLIQRSSMHIGSIHFHHMHIGDSGKVALASTERPKIEVQQQVEARQESVQPTVEKEKTVEKVVTKPLPPAPKPADPLIPNAPSPYSDEWDKPLDKIKDEEPQDEPAEVVPEKSSGPSFEDRLKDIDRLLGK